MIQRDHMMSAHRLSDVRHSQLLISSLSFLPTRRAAAVTSISVRASRFPELISPVLCRVTDGTKPFETLSFFGKQPSGSTPSPGFSPRMEAREGRSLGSL